MTTSTSSLNDLGPLKFSEGVGGPVFRSLMCAAFMSFLGFGILWYAKWAYPAAQIVLACVFGGIAVMCVVRALNTSRFRVHENGIRSVSLFGSKQMHFSQVMRIYPLSFSGDTLRTSADGRSDVYHWAVSVVRFTSRDGLTIKWRWSEDDVKPIAAASTLSLSNQMQTDRTAALLAIYSAAASNVEQEIATEGFYSWGDRKRITSRGIEYHDVQRQCWMEVPRGNSTASRAWSIDRGKLCLGSDPSGQAVYRENVDYETLFPGLLVLMRRDGTSDSETVFTVLVDQDHRPMNGVQKSLVACGLVPPEIMMG